MIRTIDIVHADDVLNEGLLREMATKLIAKYKALENDKKKILKDNCYSSSELNEARQIESDFNP